MSAVKPVQRPAVTLPPAPGFNAAALSAAWVPDDPFVLTDTVLDYYAVKASIAAWLQPRTVLEIGVRAGYSALAFHMGHPFRWYQGYDADRGDWGGVKDYWRSALATLGQLPGLDFRIAIQDSQKLASLIEPVGGLDLAHVDGDHGWAGAVHDIKLCLDAGARFTVVDDVQYVPAVLAAAEDVVTERGLTGVYIADLLGRGNLIIANSGETFPDIEGQ